MHFKQFHTSCFFVIFLITCFFLTGCKNQAPQEPAKKELLIYCGTTMAQPVRKIADLIEQQENCVVKIIINGSGDLYRSIKINRQGDLFLSGIGWRLSRAKVLRLLLNCL